MDNKLETDRKKKERYAEMDKKRKAMVDVRSFFFQLVASGWTLIKYDYDRRLQQGKKRPKSKKSNR